MASDRAGIRDAPRALQAEAVAHSRRSAGDVGRDLGVTRPGTSAQLAGLERYERAALAKQKRSLRPLRREGG